MYTVNPRVSRHPVAVDAQVASRNLGGVVCFEGRLFIRCGGWVMAGSALMLAVLGGERDSCIDGAGRDQR